MRLLDIWNSREAWQTLAALKKPPRLAYQLRQYQRQVQEEIQTCDSQREAYVYEVSGEPQGSVVSLVTDSDQYRSFLAKFNAFLLVESSLEWSGITMEALINDLDAEKGNVLSENDIAALEVFFTKPQADLKLVSKEG